MQGPPGPQGARGPQGPPGPKGDIGPPGLPSIGAIIPFASGPVVRLSTQESGEAGEYALISFGNSYNTFKHLTLPINDEVYSFAFNVPVDSTISALSATFVPTITMSIGDSTIKVYVQLFIANSNSDNFIPLSQTNLEVGVYTGEITRGMVSTNIINNINVTIPQGTRLLLVTYAKAENSSCSMRILGKITAGLSLK